MGDSFLSVEHLVLAFPLDKRFGEKLFKDLQLSEQALKDAVHAIRGSQRVNDQSMYKHLAMNIYAMSSNETTYVSMLTLKMNHCVVKITSISK